MGFQKIEYSSDSADDVDLHAAISSDENKTDIIKNENLKSGDFIIVQLKGLKNTYHYVARVDNPVSEDLDVELNLFGEKTKS